MDFSTANPSVLQTHIDNRTGFDEKRQGSKYALVVSGDEEERVVKLYWAPTAHIDQEKMVFRSPDEAINWITFES